MSVKFSTPFVVSLSNHEQHSPFDRLRANLEMLSDAIHLRTIVCEVWRNRVARRCRQRKSTRHRQTIKREKRQALLRHLQQAEANAAVVVVGTPVTAVRQPSVRGGREKTSAACDTPRTRRWPLGMLRWALRIIRAIKPILAPFPHVPMHIVQSPDIRLFLPNRMGLLF